jgi:hypothetical protein
VTTTAAFVPTAAITHCIGQVIAAKRGAADKEALAAAAAAAAAAAEAAKPPPSRASALRANAVIAAAGSSSTTANGRPGSVGKSSRPVSVGKANSSSTSSSSKKSDKATATAAASNDSDDEQGLSSGQQRAVVHGRAQAGAQRLRRLGEINAANMTAGGEGNQPSLLCMQSELRDPQGAGVVGAARKRAGPETQLGALHVEQVCIAALDSTVLLLMSSVMLCIA